jgi:hypothetical protein
MTHGWAGRLDAYGQVRHWTRPWWWRHTYRRLARRHRRLIAHRRLARRRRRLGRAHRRLFAHRSLARRHRRLIAHRRLFAHRRLARRRHRRLAHRGLLADRRLITVTITMTLVPIPLAAVVFTALVSRMPRAGPRSIIYRRIAGRLRVLTVAHSVVAMLLRRLPVMWRLAHRRLAWWHRRLAYRRRHRRFAWWHRRLVTHRRLIARRLPVGGRLIARRLPVGGRLIARRLIAHWRFAANGRMLARRLAIAWWLIARWLVGIITPPRLALIAWLGIPAVPLAVLVELGAGPMALVLVPRSEATVATTRCLGIR